MKPYKVETKHEEILVYSHRNNDYITVEVDCDYRLYFFYIPEFDWTYEKSILMKEVKEFQLGCKVQETKIKEMLSQNQVPFK